MHSKNWQKAEQMRKLRFLYYDKVNKWEIPRIVAGWTNEKTQIQSSRQARSTYHGIQVQHPTPPERQKPENKMQ